MKRLMIITAVFALLLTGCGTRVSHNTLIELSVNSITEYQNRVNDIHLKFTQELPIADEKVEDIAKKLPEDHPIVQQIKEHLLLERDRYFMEKRLKCMMETTRFTPERLKNEFPEAYLIYMDVVTADWNEKRDDTKKPASNLCDTIENIRATLKPNLKEALKHDKEEE